MKADSNIARPRPERVLAFVLPPSPPAGAVAAAVVADVIESPARKPATGFPTARPTASVFRNPCFCTPAEAYDTGLKHAQSRIGQVIALTGRLGPWRGKLIATRIVGQAEGYASWDIAFSEAKRLARESGKCIYLAHYGIGGSHRVSYSGTWLVELEGPPIVRGKTRVTPPRDGWKLDFVNPAGDFLRDR